MITPKEKALDLVDNFRKHTYEPVNTQAKGCALIAVDEILEECRLEKDWFWQEVKIEIEKL